MNNKMNALEQNAKNHGEFLLKILEISGFNLIIILEE